MTFNSIRMAGLALAATAMMTTQAKAAFVLYNTGDLLLGFEKTGVANNLVVNLGSALNFTLGGSYYNAGVATLVPGLALNDLVAVFGAGWASNTGTQVQWGVVGGNSRTVTDLGLPKNTLFYTQGRLDTSIQTTARLRQNNGAQNSINGNIQGLANTVSNTDSTANSSTSAIIAAAGVDPSWTSNSPAFGNAGGWGSVEQPASGSYTGPTNSVLDLYEALNTTQTPGGSANAAYLGSFNLDSSGNLFFTAAAVPEPSTYALVALGIGGLALLRRRANKLALSKSNS